MSEAGVRRRVGRVLVVCAALVLGGPVALSPTTATAPPIATPAAEARPDPQLPTGSAVDPQALTPSDRAEIAALFARRSTALLARDRAAFLADLDPGSATFVTAQKALFDNLADVPLRRFDWVVTTAGLLPTADARFAAYAGRVVGLRVDLRYQIDGIDAQPDVRGQSFTLTRGSVDEWRLASDTDFDDLGPPTWRGVWDFGPVVAVSTPHGLLLAHPGRAAALPGLAVQVEQAVATVTSLWGTGWRQRVLVLLPDSTAELQKVGDVGIPLTQLAAVAVAASVDYVTGRATGQRVLLNPTNLDAMGDRATLAVLAHEITHIAARTVTRPGTPMWLVEGFADVVGFLAVDAPPRQVGAQLRAQLAAGDVPTTLPADAAFAADGASLNGVYTQAWMACRLLGQQLGGPGLVAFYRAVAGSTDPAVVLRQELTARLGLTYDQFVVAWIADLTANLS